MFDGLMYTFFLLFFNSSEADFIKKIVKEVQKVTKAIGLEGEENHLRKNEEKMKGRELQLPIRSRI